MRSKAAPPMRSNVSQLRCGIADRGVVELRKARHLVGELLDRFRRLPGRAVGRAKNRIEARMRFLRGARRLHHLVIDLDGLVPRAAKNLDAHPRP
jgi:hypothetical protein